MPLIASEEVPVVGTNRITVCGSFSSVHLFQRLVTSLPVQLIDQM